MPAIIYLVTNTLDGKQYVGFTTDYDGRMRSHKRADDPCHFHHAIRKHGWENFAVDVIFEHDDEKWTLNVMEPHFIAWYDTLASGYNMTPGGEAPPLRTEPLTEEHKRKIGEAHKGKKKSAAHRRAMSEAHKGSTLSEEQRRKIGDTQSLGRIRLTNAITGEVLEFPSLNNACLSGFSVGKSLKQGTLYKKTWRVERV